MASSPATAARRPRSGAGRGARAAAAEKARRRARSRRRRAAALVLLVLGGALGLAVVSGAFDTAVREITLPLKHEDIIRQQAADKDLDPALIAGVIYTESRFVNGQTSSAGAQGLMQVTPGTAGDIARMSGGDSFRVEDLGTPQVNISYGSYYLRYLLNRYAGDETLALAAYNGGEGNVDRWLARETQAGRRFSVRAIPFPETRAYVGKVQSARRDYRGEYAVELGL